MFQTAEYASALPLARQTDTSDEAIGALVAARMARWAIFGQLDPPDVVVVLDEAVLRYPVTTVGDGRHLLELGYQWLSRCSLTVALLARFEAGLPRLSLRSPRI